MKSSRRYSVVALALSLLLVGRNPFHPSQAQSVYDVKEHYTKLETQIVMRDGAKLFTSIYMPKNTSQKCSSLTMVLMGRTVTPGWRIGTSR